MEVPEFEAFFRKMFPRLVRYGQRSFSAAQAEDLAIAALEVMWRKDLPAPTAEQDENRHESLAFHVMRGLMQNATRAEGSSRRMLGSLARQRFRNAEDVAESVLVDRWPRWAEDLPSSDRELLGMVADGYKVNEIAGILGRTPAAVSMRLRRARDRARELWEAQGVDHEQRRR